MRKPSEQEMRARNAVELVTAFWERANENQRLRLAQVLAALAAYGDEVPDILVNGSLVRRGA
jgi:hypothetical protein